MHSKSYAKVNLGLHIVNKRQDGFHNIDTIFHHINLFDVITISRSSSITISCSDPRVPVNSENLCWKAAVLVQKVCSISEGIHIDIQKNIPVGAGLGGGSSNAAAILRSMPGLFGTAIDRPALESMALELGSDVPFFLRPESAFGEGRGEILSYFRLMLPYWIVLINPGIHVSTPWAYSTLSEKYHGMFPTRKRLKEIFTDLNDLPALQNDFETVVFTEFPAIRTIKESLLGSGAVQALMSGSGSSVFGLFEREDDARNAAARFSQHCFVHLTEPNFTLA